MIEIKNLSRHYMDGFGYKIELFENLSFEILKNKITSIIAPSGAGKTPLLKILAGLENPSSGEITNKDQSVIYIPSEPSSFPWLSTKENILFGLREVNESELNDILEITGLEGYENHYPNNKSIGYRFRISFARSLIRKPSLIVIDEPFNKMEGSTKTDLYILLREAIKSLHTTILLATTNISEAVFLSDVIYLMHKNPSRIIEKIIIQLPEIRDNNILFTKEFRDYRLSIEEKFKSTDSHKLVNITI